LDYLLFDMAGYVDWLQLPDGSYLVDPASENEFLSVFSG